MGTLRGDPALRYLARAKLRGLLRRQQRRLKSVSGAVFALLGALMGLIWLGSLLLTIMANRGGAVPPELTEPVVRLAMALLAALSISGNITQRGLYLPPGELERLFSAPLSRSAILRYRLNTLLLRSLFGGLLVAAAAAVRLPSALPAALAGLLAVAFVTLLGQGVALLLGAIENRARAEVLRFVSRLVFLALLGLSLGVLFLALTLDQMPDFRDLPRWLEHPWTERLTWPFTPWAKLATAQGPAELGLWGGVCALLLLAVYEGVARLPLDFREWVLESSQALARRLRRLQSSGTGAAATLVSARSAGRRVPWLFGRGPLGAVAWRKSAGLWRRARSTLGFSALILTLLVALSEATIGRQQAPGALISSLLTTALLGTLYLCSGLRFDFREDLDRLDAIKSWPLPPRRLFLAMLLPEWLAATLLLGLALLLQLLVGRGLPSGPIWAELLAVGLPLPLVVGLWLALDNAIFLVWPVRLVPGQDGPLQNIGRALVLLLLRGLCFGLSAAFAAGCLWVAWGLFGQPTTPVVLWLSGALAVSAGLSVALWLALTAGGRALRRFDPSLDKP